MKSVKPADRRARPQKIIQIVGTRTIRNEAANDRGAFQYQKSKPAVRRIKYLAGKGQYLGDNNKISAFIWIDEQPEDLKAA